MRPIAKCLWKPRLEPAGISTHLCHMSTKQIVQDLLERLPENASLHDVAREVEFVAAVRDGLEELDRGERISIDDLERELPTWLIK